MRKMREILLSQYIGAITIGFLAAQGIMVLIVGFNQPADVLPAVARLFGCSRFQRSSIAI